MRAIAEEVYPQLVTHAVVTLVVGKLDKGDHLLQRSEGLHPLLVAPCLSDRFADPLQASWRENMKDRMEVEKQITQIRVHQTTGI